MKIEDWWFRAIRIPVLAPSYRPAIRQGQSVSFCRHVDGLFLEANTNNTKGSYRQPQEATSNIVERTRSSTQPRCFDFTAQQHEALKQPSLLPITISSWSQHPWGPRLQS